MFIKQTFVGFILTTNITCLKTDVNVYVQLMLKVNENSKPVTTNAS